MQTEPTVFVVDDDEDLRQALRWLIESAGLRVETFDSAEAFLGANRLARPGCLLLDIRMPGMGGMRLLEHLRRSDGFRGPVIVLTGHGDIPMAVQALRMGAIDFIEKPALDHVLLDRLLEAVAIVRDRQAQAEQVAAIGNVLSQLTAREREVLDRVVAGQSSKVIGLELGISERTVEKFRSNIMRKTQADSLAALVRLVLLQRQDLGVPLAAVCGHDWSSP